MIDKDMLAERSMHGPVGIRMMSWVVKKHSYCREVSLYTARPLQISRMGRGIKCQRRRRRRRCRCVAPSVRSTVVAVA